MGEPSSALRAPSQNHEFDKVIILRNIFLKLEYSHAKLPPLGVLGPYITLKSMKRLEIFSNVCFGLTSFSINKKIVRLNMESNPKTSVVRENAVIFDNFFPILILALLWLRKCPLF